MKDRPNTLKKVQALIAQAESTTFPAEKDAFLAKADELMLRHAIEEWEFGLVNSQQRIKPVSAKMPVCSNKSDIQGTLMDLFCAIASTTRCRAVMHVSNYKQAREETIISTIVGFPDDIDYCNMLFTSIKLQLMLDLEPKVDPNLSYLENLAMLKEAGVKWTRNYELLVKAGLLADVPWERRFGVRFTQEYAKYCKADPTRNRQTVAPVTYQKSFAEGFVREVRRRLWVLERHRTGFTTGKELVLSDRKQEVTNLFQELFPRTSLMKVASHKFNESAFASGKISGAKADLSEGRKVTTNSKQLS